MKIDPEITNSMNNMIQDTVTILQRRRVPEIVKLAEIWQETGEQIDKWNKQTEELLHVN